MQTSNLRGDLATRIEKLADDTSLSHLARKTGFHLTNVSRYAKGTRISADFCMALVTNLEVNPTWLLTGEGAPYLSDVSQRTEKMAGDVLELVEAMNTVSQMRLGALTGKHHLRVLRELNDALMKYEDLRVRLNQHSLPIFRRILDDLDAALKATDFERVTELRKAARQVERLCDDHELSRRFTAMQSHCEALDLNYEGSIHYQRKLIRDTLAEGLVESNEQCEEFVRLVITLAAAEGSREAVRLCRALVELVGEDRRDWPGFCRLQCFRGKLLSKHGELYEGLALMQRYASGIDAARAPAVRMDIADATLLAGFITFDEMRHFDDKRISRGLRLVEYAMWLEDAGRLKQAVECLGPAVKQVQGYVRIPDLAEFVLRAIEGDKTAPEQFAETVRKKSGKFRETLLHLSSQAKMALLVGDRSRARRWTQKAHKIVEATPDILGDLDILVPAQHYRNVLRLSMKGKPREQAEDFFRKSIDAGYHIFEPELCYK